MDTKWLSCSVSPGQFPGEYAVAGVQHNGKPFSLFAPQEAVSAPPSGEGTGLMHVEVVDRRGDLVLVRLPAQTFENGQYITVNAKALQPTPTPQQVAV
jgi:hypothetical protein